MNKRGQIPILMLFLVAVILVIVALVSFYNFGRDFGDRSLLVSKTVAGVQVGNDYVVESAKLAARTAIKTGSDDISGEFRRATANQDIGVQEAGNFFAYVEDSKFSLVPVEDVYVLKIDGLFVQASSGNNAIRRDFNLCMLFDKDGGYLENYANAKDYSEKCGTGN